MIRPDSEIFNEYVKIAEKQGLVKDADYASARVGSDSLSVIELLYDVKPNDEKKDEIYSTLLDQAHPEPVVIAPAHDRLNGVLENLKERQSIMSYIALKNPDGIQNHRRYIQAQEELLKSLVRVGFTMDNENQTELMKLADSCAGRLVKQAVLPAFVAGALPYIAGIAVLLGGLALINRTDNARKGVANNAEDVLIELSKLKQSQLVQEIASELKTLQALSRGLEPIYGEYSSAEGAINLARENQDKLNSMKEYISILQKTLNNIPTWSVKLDNLSQVENPEYNSDWFEKIKDVAREAFSKPTGAKGVILALGGLAKSINVTLDISKQIVADVHSKMQKQIQQNPEFVSSIMSAQNTSSGGGVVKSFVDKQLSQVG